MMRKKIKRKSMRGIFRLSDVMIGVLSVLVGYSVVAIELFPHRRLRESRLDTLTSSAHRVAIAFEQYNEKRFTP